jgi:hypothetical protein
LWAKAYAGSSPAEGICIAAEALMVVLLLKIATYPMSW